MSEDKQEKKEEKKVSTENKESKEKAKKEAKKKSDMKILAGVIVVVIIGYVLASPDLRSRVTSVFSSKSSSSLEVVKDIDTEDSKQFSYAIGSMFSESIASSLDQIEEQGDALDREVVAQAIEDVLLEKDSLKMTQEQVEEFLTLKQEEAQERLAVQSQENEASGKAFREEYKKGDGVEEIEGGILYKEMTSGSGALVGERVALVQYEGKTVDGTVFDSSEQNGGESVPFSSAQVIPGLGSALALMQVGDTWEIVVPGELAYGDQGIPGVIDPGATLIFTITVEELQ